MSIRRLQQDCNARDNKHVNPVGESDWVRNPCWPKLEYAGGVTQTNGFMALVAVYPDSNFLAFKPTQTAGNFYIEWLYYNGIGYSNQNIASNTQGQFSHSWSSPYLYDSLVTFQDATDTVTRTAHGYIDGMQISFSMINTTTGINQNQNYFVVNATTNTFQLSNTRGGSVVALTTDGDGRILPYKMAIVGGGASSGNLTALSFQPKHTQTLLQYYTSGILDLLIDIPYGTGSTGLLLGSSTVAASTVQYHYHCEQVKITGQHSITQFTSLFGYMQSLQSFYIEKTSGVINMGNMFQGTIKLRNIPYFDTSSCQSFSNMFQNSGVVTVPDIITSSGNTFGNMFSGCVNLKRVPKMDFSGLGSINITSMFYGCASLKYVPDMYFPNAVGTSNSASTLFLGCSSLVQAPYIDTGTMSNISGMFRGCSSLKSIPNYDLSNVTTFSSASAQLLASCISLGDVLRFNIPKATNITNIFYYVSQEPTCVKKIDFANSTGLVTAAGSAFNGQSQLESIIGLNLSGITSAANITSAFNNCQNLSTLDFGGANQGPKYTFSVANCKLSATALNNIYSQLPTITGQTITVTGNWGTATDDPTIATAKGWTVTG